MSFFFWRRNAKCVSLFLIICFLGYLTFWHMQSRKAGDANDDDDDDDDLEVFPGTCARPVLDLWPKLIKEIYKTLTTINCSTLSEENWAYINNGRFRISEQAVSIHGPIECKYQVVTRKDGDMKTGLSEESKPIRHDDPLPSDTISIKCASRDGKVFSRVLVGVKQVRDNRTNTSPEKGLNLDIIMFGFDSVSSMTWRRSLPKTHEYFINQLGGVLLEGYNIVGDGTPQALLPILIGKTEEELPEARRGFPNANVVDGHPWIWNELKKRGYMTQWGEDGASFGTFTYRMLGFDKQPVDHYMRPFYLAQNSISMNCDGSIETHKLHINYLKEFLQVYGLTRRKFSFNFHSDYSHGSSKLVQNADNDLLQLLQWLNSTGALDHALLIFMADHGARFTNLRSSEQGKYEERLPYFALRLPSNSSLRDKFPEIEQNLRANAKLLTTPFDIHETMMDVLDYVAQKGTELPPNRPYPRGFSLFRKIPADRGCADAAIKNHWCTCMKWLDISIDDSKVQDAAKELVSMINHLTESFRTDCAELKLLVIKSASVAQSRRELLKFKGSKDTHGRIADLSDTMESNQELYQINLLTLPNHGEYEATVTYDLTSKKMSINENEISRLNAYGNQPNCVSSKHPHLRQFCFCVNH